MGNRAYQRDPEGRETTWVHDKRNRLESVTNGEQETTSYSYDLNGNRTRLTDPDGKHTVYVYDKLNRLHQAQAEGGTTTYRYDRSSLIKQVSYPNNTETRYSYDDAGRTGCRPATNTTPGATSATKQELPGTASALPGMKRTRKPG